MRDAALASGGQRVSRSMAGPHSGPHGEAEHPPPPPLRPRRRVTRSVTGRARPCLTGKIPRGSRMATAARAPPARAAGAPTRAAGPLPAACPPHAATATASGARSPYSSAWRGARRLVRARRPPPHTGPPARALVPFGAPLPTFPTPTEPHLPRRPTPHTLMQARPRCAAPSWSGCTIRAWPSSTRTPSTRPSRRGSWQTSRTVSALGRAPGRQPCARHALPEPGPI